MAKQKALSASQAKKAQVVQRGGNPPRSLKGIISHSLKIMNKFSVIDVLFLILFISWTSMLDINNLTMIQVIGLGATAIWFVLLCVKVMKR